MQPQISKGNIAMILSKEAQETAQSVRSSVFLWVLVFTSREVETYLNMLHDHWLWYFTHHHHTYRIYRSVYALSEVPMFLGHSLNATVFKQTRYVTKCKAKIAISNYRYGPLTDHRPD